MSLGAEDAVRRLVTLARDLRRAPDIERRTRGYERQLEALFERVFDDGALASIGDLRLIDDIWEILRENDLDESYPEALAQLKERRAVVADAHAKLSDILHPTVSLRDLLYERLDDWLGLPTSVGVAFTADQETELDIIRSSDDPPDHRLRRFLDQYLAWVEPTSAPVVERLRSVIATHLPVLQEMRDTHAVTALFAERGGATGRALRLSVIVSPGAGEEFGANTVDEAMKMAVRQASIAAFTAEQMPRQRSNVSWAIDEPTTYEGASIGLAAAIGVLAGLRCVVVDPYSAFTGTVALDGSVGTIEHVGAKAAAAGKLGLTRLFVPTANEDEATQAITPFPHARVIPVRSIAEAWSLLTARHNTISQGTASLSSEVRRAELDCIRAGLKIHEKIERQGHVQLNVTDNTSRGSLTVYQGKSGVTLVAGGKPGTRLHTTLTTLAAQSKPTALAPAERMKERWVIPEQQEREKVESALRAVRLGVERQEANCSYRIDYQEAGERVIARQFASGTLTLQQVSGSADSPLYFDLRGRIRAALGQQLDSVDRTAMNGEAGPDPRSAVTAVDPARVFTGTWIGTDEAGKGDYFGPLVSAAVYVDDAIVGTLQRLGVRDSKKLSDGRVRELASAVRDQVGGRVFRVVPLVPASYNRLQAQFVKEGKSLTTLLAWAHARAIEDLLKRDVDTDNVLVDQFTDVQYIKSALLAEGRRRQVNLVALPRAEANIAVAAASILARDHYLAWMNDQSRRLGLVLPKGASDAVVPVAQELVSRFGQAGLGDYAKLHFRTTEKVLSAD